MRRATRRIPAVPRRASEARIVLRVQPRRAATRTVHRGQDRADPAHRGELRATGHRLLTRVTGPQVATMRAVRTARQDPTAADTAVTQRRVHTARHAVIPRHTVRVGGALTAAVAVGPTVAAVVTPAVADTTENFSNPNPRPAPVRMERAFFFCRRSPCLFRDCRRGT